MDRDKYNFTAINAHVVTVSFVSISLLSLPFVTFVCCVCWLPISFCFRGYIPTSKLPSSKRAQTTHERLCQHETIAQTAKECCSVPQVLVKSRVPNEVLQIEPDNHVGHVSPNENGATVADVAGDLCNEFDQWAREHYLYDVREDWGWFELTSQAF